MTMTFELDHLFVCTETNAPEADRLISFGLTEGESNVHLGQGTANRRFFFYNCMLELLWVHNREEALSEITYPTYLWERWSDRAKAFGIPETCDEVVRSRDSCPFGFCLRPASNPAAVLPFSTWAYRPAYLPKPFSIDVGTNANVLTEPMLFYLSFRKRQDSYSADQRQPLNHSSGLMETTRVTFVSPYANHLSPELEAVVNSGLIELKQGKNYRMELGFDGEKQGKHADFQPGLPLSLFW